MDKIDVLDKGYVILHETMGTDLNVVNAARVSYNKKKEELDTKDARLIKFLAKHDHTSPFRHATLQFEVYAPLMIARQWWKYVIGGAHQMDAWNESSRRYVTEEPVFYVPYSDEWRSKPENSKQGSGEVVEWEIGYEATKRLMKQVDKGMRNYEWALSVGICAEQARLFLPAYGMYVRWYWTASLQSVAHLIQQRQAADAQKEFQEYALAVKELTKKRFPVALGELINE